MHETGSCGVEGRGYSSCNGVGTAISITTGKILDCEILSRHCENCAIHGNWKEQEPTEYDVWNVNCQGKGQLNHEGSASSTEAASAITVFSRSEQNYGLRYTGYYGDGDGSSFQQVENTYYDTKVVKYECIGHYQRRVGNRSRKLRKRVKGLGGIANGKEILSCTKDGRVIKVKQKAKGKLTDAAIDRLQNYFGMALRGGTKSVPELKNALLASFFSSCVIRGL